MAERIYPEGARNNILAGMYCEIAMEAYFHATKYYQIIRENNYSAFSGYELSEMNKYIVKTVVFSAMSIESFLNDYAAACLGDSEFYSNFDKSRTNGWQLDHFMMSKSLIPCVTQFYRRKDVTISDHIPVIIHIDLSKLEKQEDGNEKEHDNEMKEDKEDDNEEKKMEEDEVKEDAKENDNEMKEEEE